MDTDHCAVEWWACGTVEDSISASVLVSYSLLCFRMGFDARVAREDKRLLASEIEEHPALQMVNMIVTGDVPQVSDHFIPGGEDQLMW